MSHVTWAPLSRSKG